MDESTAPAVHHIDGASPASDGAVIPWRRTTPAGRRPALAVMLQLGTLSRPEDGDLLAGVLAADGATTYAVQARRTGARPFTQHAADLDEVVRLARAEHPGVPLVVMGVSFGAMVALEWGTRFDRYRTPIVPMSPVVVSNPRYLGPRDLARVLAAVASREAAQTPVASPESAGVEISTNPESREWHLHDPRETVPAGFFADNLRMVVDVTVRGGPRHSPVLVLTASGDVVAWNGVTRLWTHLLRVRDLTHRDIRGAAHDLTQETNHPELASTLRGWMRAHARPPIC